MDLICKMSSCNNLNFIAVFIFTESKATKQLKRDSQADREIGDDVKKVRERGIIKLYLLEPHDIIHLSTNATVS